MMLSILAPAALGATFIVKREILAAGNIKRVCHLIQSCVRANLSHFLIEIFVKAQLYVSKLFFLLQQFMFLNVYVTHNLKEIILHLTVEL